MHCSVNIVISNALIIIEKARSILSYLDINYKKQFIKGGGFKNEDTSIVIEMQNGRLN